MVSFRVGYKKTVREFNASENTTLGELREQIAQVFGVEPSNQRLILKGKTLSDSDNELVTTTIPSGSQLLLIGTPTAQIAQFQHKELQHKESEKNYQRYRATSADVQTTRARIGSLDDKETKYTFHSFETLPNLPNREQAMDILKRLEKDEGVRQIMQKREYSVGVLRELHPAERTILGYNRNRGQVIALRLRSDDLDGFRMYESIREVLMHELAHMVWDEHDENFHRLNREHCREVIELNWTLRGQTTGGPNAQRFYEPKTEDAGDVDGGALQHSGFVLGGQTPQLPPDTDDMSEPSVRRELAYRAWQKRSGKH
ncbi:hypothetical protein IWW45_000472 [Coemansia sp. RSA 485]|nr:hypothetical protein IWW45_000472 [Coemansia sp. RSA 485]